MNIDNTNYEAFILDYIEGRLDASMINELEKFIELRPDLKEILNSTELNYIVPETINYPDKQSLKKLDFQNTQITEYNLNDYCIAQTEGLLNDLKTRELYEYISQHPNHKETLNVFKKIILKPQEEIQFPCKEDLYRKSSKTILFLPYLRRASVAACLGLLATGYFIYLNKNSNEIHTTINKSVVTYTKFINKPVATFPIKPTPNSEKEKLVKGMKSTHKSITPKDSIRQTPEQTEELTYLQNIKVTGSNSESDIDSLKKIMIAEIDNYNHLNEVKNYSGSAHNQNQEEELDEESNSESTLFLIANATVKQFNKITGSNIKIADKKRNTSNQITFSFQSGSFEYYHSKSN